MRLSLRAVWASAASFACISVVAEPTRTMEVDMVFPRRGTNFGDLNTLPIWAPMPYMPIVFALRNASLAQYTYPYIAVRIIDESKPDFSYAYTQHLNVTNFNTTEPLFVYTVVDTFAREGDWRIEFDLWWVSCNEVRGRNTNGSWYALMQPSCSCEHPARFPLYTRAGKPAFDFAKDNLDGNTTQCIAKYINVGEELVNPVFRASMSMRVGWKGLADGVEVRDKSRPGLVECPVAIPSALAASITSDIAARIAETSAAPRLAAVVGPVSWAAAAVWAFGLF